MPSPHDLALFTMTAGAGIGALLMADAADEALQRIAEIRRRRAVLLMPTGRVRLWVRPVMLHCTSLAFLCGMATSGAFLVGAFPS